MQEVNKMRNVTKEERPQNQKALEDPNKDTVDNLEDLDPAYHTGFDETLLVHVSVASPTCIVYEPLLICHIADQAGGQSVGNNSNR